MIVKHKVHISFSHTVRKRLGFVAMTRFDAAALGYHLQPRFWNRFQDDILTVWTHGNDTLKPFPEFLNQIRSTCKFKFTS